MSEMNFNQHRFTAHGSDALEGVIADHMKIVVREIGFAAGDAAHILLGGGAARKEAGSIVDESGEHIATPYVFYVIYEKRPAHKKDLKKRFSDLCKLIEERTGNKTYIRGPVLRSKITTYLFPLELSQLIQSHLVLQGDQGILKNIDAVPFNKIPQEEAMRLLLRGAKFFLRAFDRLDRDTRRDSDSRDVAQWIYHGFMLSVDALLLTLGNFKSTMKEREALIAKNESFVLIRNLELALWYKKSRNYVEKPEKEMTIDELQTIYNQLIKIFKTLYFHIFESCCGKNVNTTKKYCNAIKNYPDGTSKVQSLFENIREFGIQNFDKRWFFKKPIYRLFYVLPFFLFSFDEYDKMDVITALGEPNINENVLKTRFFNLIDHFGY